MKRCVAKSKGNQSDAKKQHSVGSDHSRASPSILRLQPPAKPPTALPAQVTALDYTNCLQLEGPRVYHGDSSARLHQAHQWCRVAHVLTQGSANPFLHRIQQRQKENSMPSQRSVVCCWGFWEVGQQPTGSRPRRLVELTTTQHTCNLPARGDRLTACVALWTASATRPRSSRNACANWDSNVARVSLVSTED